MTDVFVDEEGLELNDPPRLVWVRVQDAVGLIWRDNPKRHDMQSLTTSIERYGFQEPAKFDAKLLFGVSYKVTSVTLPRPTAERVRSL